MSQDIQSLTSLLCHLVTNEVEIARALEASDQEVSGYIDFRHDLAHAIALALDPDQPTEQEPDHD